MYSRLALGTVQFGMTYGIANKSGQVKFNQLENIIKVAQLNRINLLDTAISYGESESALGRAGVADWNIVSKLPTVPQDCSDIQGWVLNEITNSLKRLRVQSLYGLLLHDPNQLLSSIGPQIKLGMLKARRLGMIDKIGVSIYGPENLSLICSVMKPDIVQAPLNLVDRRLVKSGWLRKLSDDGVEIHTRSTFLQGLLLMPPPPKFLPWKDIWIRWQAWHKNNFRLALNACLAYPLSYPEVNRVIVGVDSQSHLEDLIKIENAGVIKDLPDLSCEDESLINPSNWKDLN